METNSLLATLEATANALANLDASGADVSELTDGALLDALRRASHLAGRIAALEISLAGEADERSTARPDDEKLARSLGCRNTTELLQKTTLISARNARGRLYLARVTRQQMSLTGADLPPRFPSIAAGLGSGKLPLESAALISRTLEGPNVVAPDVVDMAERYLVQAGSGLDLGVEGGGNLPVHADDLRAVCRLWEQALDPDGAEPDDEAVMRRRGLNLGRQKHGLVSVTGWLLPEVAAMLARIFDAVGSPAARSANQRAETMASGTGDPDEATALPVVETRTQSQKRHDIFAMALNLAAKSQEIPLLGGAPVTVMIQIQAEDIESGRGVGWLHGFDGSLTPVSQATVRQAACSGAVQNMGQGRAGRILALDTPGRIFTANQRRAIMVRDGGCVIPGCTIPATWCEIHHVEPHARGGPTHTDNGVMLCFFHHRTIDTSGWRVRMKKGVPEIKAPPWLDPAGVWRQASLGGRADRGNPQLLATIVSGRKCT